MTPFNFAEIFKELGSSMACDSTIEGPNGQNVSKLLDLHHCPPPLFPWWQNINYKINTSFFFSFSILLQSIIIFVKIKDTKNHPPFFLSVVNLILNVPAIFLQIYRWPQYTPKHNLKPNTCEHSYCIYLEETKVLQGKEGK